MQAACEETGKVKWFVPSYLTAGESAPSSCPSRRLPSLCPWPQAASDVKVTDVAELSIVSKKKKLPRAPLCLSHTRHHFASFHAFLYSMKVCPETFIYSLFMGTVDEFEGGCCRHGAYIWICVYVYECVCVPVCVCECVCVDRG